MATTSNNSNHNSGTGNQSMEERLMIYLDAKLGPVQNQMSHLQSQMSTITTLLNSGRSSNNTSTMVNESPTPDFTLKRGNNNNKKEAQPEQFTMSELKRQVLDVLPESELIRILREACPTAWRVRELINSALPIAPDENYVLSSHTLVIDGEILAKIDMDVEEFGELVNQYFHIHSAKINLTREQSEHEKEIIRLNKSFGSFLANCVNKINLLQQTAEVATSCDLLVDEEGEPVAEAYDQIMAMLASFLFCFLLQTIQQQSDEQQQRSEHQAAATGGENEDDKEDDNQPMVTYTIEAIKCKGGGRMLLYSLSKFSARLHEKFKRSQTNHNSVARKKDKKAGQEGRQTAGEEPLVKERKGRTSLQRQAMKQQREEQDDDDEEDNDYHEKTAKPSRQSQREEDEDAEDENDVEEELSVDEDPRRKKKRHDDDPNTTNKEANKTKKTSKSSHANNNIKEVPPPFAKINKKDNATARSSAASHTQSSYSSSSNRSKPTQQYQQSQTGKASSFMIPRK